MIGFEIFIFIFAFGWIAGKYNDLKIQYDILQEDFECIKNELEKR